MNRKKRRFVAGVLASIIGFLAIFTLITALALPVSAKTTRNGRVQDSHGNVYILRHGKPRTGWFTYHGKRYYGHKTGSKNYPKGSVSTNTYRVKHGKLYYFGPTGAKQTKDSRYITLNRHSTSVHYIYSPGMIRRWRYNANHKREQYLTDNGKWVDLEGMQYWPEGLIDWQR